MTVIDIPSNVPPPVEGRECGNCNVCCVVLTIDDPELKKVQGVRCPNALPDNRCGIYETRPRTCRTFLCGWRMLRWVRPGLRPDLAGVLVRPVQRTIDGAVRMTVSVTLLSEAGVEADGIAETMAAAVAAGLPVFLEVLGRPGYSHATARVDELLADCVRQRDKPGMLSMLRYFWTQGQMGSDKTIPVTLS